MITLTNKRLIMKQINWQDSFQSDVLEETFSADRKVRNFPESTSYTDRFTKIRQKNKRNFQNTQTHPSSFKDRYVQTVQKISSRSLKRDEIRDKTHESQTDYKKNNAESRPNNPDSKQDESNSHATIDKAPVFEFNKKSHGDRKTSESWNFLNLKNKKQTGDLYKKILFFNKKNDAKVFNFIGSRGREGVSTIFANLVKYVNSHTMEKKILVIDANSKSPSLHKTFNVSPKAPGLQDILNNKSEIREAIIPITSNIFLLCCGKGNADASGIEQDNFAKLIEYCKTFFDYVLIDCAPVLSSVDALNVAPAADYNFLVVQSANDQRPVIEKSKSLLLNDECKVAGVILNRVQQVIPGWLYKYI